MASRLAWSPRMSCAGSPGTMRTRTNTSVSTANSVTHANARRRTTNAVIVRPTDRSRRSLREARLLRDRRRQVERSLQLIAQVQRVLPRPELQLLVYRNRAHPCLLYTSDAADERSSVDLG